MNYGFITGLPRSGSAWLANYLSYGNCMFLHDAFLRKSPSEVRLKFETAKPYAAGVSDPANLLVLDEIDKEFPDAKWVLVTRDAHEVEESCNKIKFPVYDFTNSLEKLLKTREVKKVKFTDLFDSADEIGRYIYPEWECPPWRNELLKGFNVQVHWGKISEQFDVLESVKNMNDTMTPNKMRYYRLIKKIVNDDPQVLRFLVQARDLSNLYRSLDQGKPVDLKKSLEALEAVATEWISSPFLNQFYQAISTSFASSLEKYKNEKDMKHCPIDIDLLTTVTYIFKGNDGIKEFMPQVRELSDKVLEESR